MSKKKKRVDLSSEKAIEKEFGKVISNGSELIDSKKDYKTLPVSPSLDLALNGGLLEGTWTIVSGNPKTGKSQPLDSIVYTVDGPVRMGDIEVGTEVCSPDGGYAKVLSIHPQGELDVFEVEFDDGSKTQCSGDHNWLVRKNNRNKSPYVVMKLHDIVDSGLKYSDRLKWKIPLAKPACFNSEELPINPYMLGCLIGDGGLTNGSPMISSSDKSIIEVLSGYAKKMGLELKHSDRYDYRFSCGNQGGKPNPLTVALRELNLMGKSSHEKFIPNIYKYSSVEQRFELINGLMDTDGFNDRGKVAEYTTVSAQLADDVIEVLQSLGYKAKKKERTTKCNGKEFKSFRIHISGDNVSDLFCLLRKQYDTKRTKPKLTRSIKSVKHVGKKICQCILVDHPDHLYLTDNFIVTHNTTSVLQICKNAQDEGRPIIYVDVETRLKTYNLQGIEKLDLDKMQIVHGPHDEDDPLAAEDFLKITESLIRMPKNKGAICVLDSTSSLLPRAELEEDPSSSLRASLPKLMTHWIKKNAQTIVRNRIIFVAITHYITNTSGYGKTKVADGGVQLQYQADTKLDVVRIEDWLEGGDSGKKIGQKIHWKIGCSSLGASGSECISYLKYGKGIDKHQEIIELATSFGIIEKAGSWFTLQFLDEPVKMQGVHKVYEYLEQNPEAFDKVCLEVKEMLC